MSVSRLERRMIRDYYDYHGDKNVKIVDKIADKDGYDMILVRLTDGGTGSEISTLVDLHGYASEFCSTERERESEMITRFTNGGEE